MKIKVISFVLIIAKHKEKSYIMENVWDGFFKNDEDRIIKKVLMLFPETQCIIKPSN